MNKDSKIFIAGHRGLVGSAIVRKLNFEGYTNLIFRTSTELDLMNQADVEKFFNQEKPEYVILAAAKVGGIAANMAAPAEFLYNNTIIEANVIHSSYKYGVKKLLFLASSCIYPRLCPQPMKEEYLLDGKVEPTNEGYAISKIVGMKMCEMYNKQYGTDYISIMPCNIFGIGDSYDPQRAHVVGALIRKFYEGKMNNDEFVEVWGTGNARRELLFVDDLADASYYFMQNYSGNEFFNIGTGKDVSIKELAYIIKDIVGFKGEVKFDSSKPDGMPQKLMDVSKASDAGWKYKTELEEGIKLSYQDFLNNPMRAER
jgi:GDP-L-fucose synthase